MKRRSFLSLSALSAVPVVARAAEDAPEPDWHETVTSDVMKFRGSDAEERVVFEVELFQPAETALPLQFKNPQIGRRFVGRLDRHERAVPCKGEEPGGRLRINPQSSIVNLFPCRVSLSAEGGTVLIEWERPEECDSHSTIRWIVSKSGVVLRHRHCPPHEC